MKSSVYRRIRLCNLVLMLVVLILVTGCTVESPTQSTSIVAASEQANPQIVDGFEDYNFPTPELAQDAGVVAAVGQVVETGGITAGRVSQAALANSGDVAADMNAAVPVVSGMASQPQQENAPLAAVAVAQRPIPTVSAEEAVNAAVAAARKIASGSMEPLVTVDRDLFLTYLRTYRDALRDLVYIADMALGSGSINCDNVRAYMATIDSVPRQMSVPLDLQLPSYYLQLGFDGTDAALRPIANYCAVTAGTVAMSSIPADITANMFPAAQYALQDVYEAVLWVTGDSAKVRELYFNTRNKIVAYQSLLAAGNASCFELNAQYEAIVYSPRLSLPEGQVANTYQHYATAINMIAEAGGALYQACASGGVPTADAVALATAAITNSLNQIDIAITYLP